MRDKGNAHHASVFGTTESTLGSLYQIVSNPIAQPSRFANERDMETFLAEHGEMLAEHLVSPDNEGRVVAMWRKEVLTNPPEKGGTARLDLLFALQDGERLVLFLAELKNEHAGAGAVSQVASYLEAWPHPDNAGLRQRVSSHLVHVLGVAEDVALAVANVPSGVLVTPGFLPDAINGLVAWAQKHPDRPIQALKLFRFRMANGQGYAVFVDDTYVVPRPGTRRTIRWAELREARPDLVTADSVFVLYCGSRLFEATPDFGEGRGKNLFLAQHHVQEALDLFEGMVPGEWERQFVPRVPEALRNGRSLPMTSLTGFLFWVFGGGGKGQNYQVPAPLWSLRDDPQHRTIQQLDALLK